MALRRTELRRKTPMPRPTKTLKRRTPLRAQSAKEVVRFREYLKVRRWVLSRANGLCEAQITGVCEGRGSHAHHILMRSQGGPDDVGNLLWVCLPCHRRIHAEPEWSYERGFLRHGLAADAGRVNLAALAGTLGLLLGVLLAGASGHAPAELRLAALLAGAVVVALGLVLVMVASEPEVDR